MWKGGYEMPNIMLYQASIAAEFEAQKDRVRYFIGGAHWGEDGRFKEILLSDFLKNVLPDNVAVGTGFVRNANKELTHQIDVIIYKKDHPCLFQKGDFVILMPESVLGIIEVKSTVSMDVLTRRKQETSKSVIERCEDNGRIIGNKQIFNGIWGYESSIHINSVSENELGEQLSNCKGYLNHICFNSSLFCRYWANGNPKDRNIDNRPCFSFYDLSSKRVFDQNDKNKPGLAFGYFISNLIEYTYKQVLPNVLTKQYFEFLYTFENTKEAYRYKKCEIKIDENTK